MRYDVVIERSSLIYGRRSPKQVSFRTIETDDPFDFVIQNETDLLTDVDFEIDENTRGIITISFALETQRVKYEFIEVE